MKRCRWFRIPAALLGLVLVLAAFSPAYAASQEVSMAIEGRGETHLPVFQYDDHDPQEGEHDPGMENHTGEEGEGHEQPEAEARHEPDSHSEMEEASHPDAGEHGESEAAVPGPSWGILGGFLGINLIILVVAAVMKPRTKLVKS